MVLLRLVLSVTQSACHTLVMTARQHCHWSLPLTAVPLHCALPLPLPLDWCTAHWLCTANGTRPHDCAQSAQCVPAEVSAHAGAPGTVPLVALACPVSSLDSLHTYVVKAKAVYGRPAHGQHRRNLNTYYQPAHVQQTHHLCAIHKFVDGRERIPRWQEEEHLPWTPPQVRSHFPQGEGLLP